MPVLSNHTITASTRWEASSKNSFRESYRSDFDADPAHKLSSVYVPELGADVAGDVGDAQEAPIDSYVVPTESEEGGNRQVEPIAPSCDINLDG